MKIISADERLKEQTGVKMAIFGQYGIGKTSLLKTLKEETLCLDFEAGMLSVMDWKGDSVKLRTWEEARDIACIIGGANPALRSDAIYSNKHFSYISEKYNIDLSKYTAIFIDSISTASKLCLTWSKMQTETYSEKTGKQDIRQVYGILANEMTSWLNQFQHIPNKDVVFVGLLEQRFDEFNRPIWSPQVEGSKTANEIPGILDEVLTLAAVKTSSGELERKFICKTINSYGYPAKDRSGKLNEIEDADLGTILNKIKTMKV